MKFQKLDAFKGMSLEKEALSCLFGGADCPTESGSHAVFGDYSADTTSTDSEGQTSTTYHTTTDKSTAEPCEEVKALQP
jgi:hypothetical protein